MIKRIIDQSGFFIRDDFTANDGEIALDVAPAQGFYLPKWDGTQWIEGKTQAEIDAILAQATPSEPSTDEVIDNLITTLVDKGVLY